MRNNKKRLLIFFVIAFFGLCLLSQTVSQSALDRLEDRINQLLQKGGHEYISAVCITDFDGTAEIHIYFLQELAGQQYASKLTLVGTLVGNLTEGTSVQKGRLKFFETEKNMLGWLSLTDCREATKIEDFKERQSFILSKLHHEIL